jgi:hypothetical protein
MTTPRTAESRIFDWVQEEGNVQLPDRILDATFAQTRATPQVGSSAWRFLPMLKPLNLLITGGAVALVLAAVLVVYKNQATTPNVGSSPTPVPTIRVLTALDQAFDLQPGTYAVGNPFGAPFTFDASSRWQVASLEQNYFELFRELTDGQTPDGSITVFRPRSVVTDACDGESLIAVSETVEGVVDALTTTDAIATGPETVANISGRFARTFSLGRPNDPRQAECFDSLASVVTFDEFGTQGHVATGSNGRAWVLDVGGRPMVIIAGGYPSTSAADQSDMEQIVNSIVFD